MARLRRRSRSVKPKGAKKKPKRAPQKKRPSAKPSSTKKKTTAKPKPRVTKATRERQAKERTRLERRKHRKRAAASRKGWETRRWQELAAINGLSDYALDFWSKLDTATSEAVLNLRWMSGIRDWREIPKSERIPVSPNSRDTQVEVMKVLQRVDSQEWRDFRYGMMRLGFTPAQTKTAWFSPKARKR